MSRASAILITIGLVFAKPVFPQDARLGVGTKAPTSIVATFVSGEFARNKDASAQEKQTTACPVLAHRDAPKVAIFVRDLNAAALRLSSAVDQLVADDETFKWSFVFVSHENDPTPSEADYQAQLINVRDLARTHHIEHLSVGVLLPISDSSGPTRARRKVGVLANNDIVVMLIIPKVTGQNALQQDYKWGFIQYVQHLNSAELDEHVLERITRELKVALGSFTKAGG